MFNNIKTLYISLFFAIIIFQISCEHPPFIPEEIAPSNLTYSTDSILLTEGDSATSVTPSIVGNTPMIYVLNSNPPNSLIKIDAEGKISVRSNLTKGTYLITVTAENAAGAKTFENIFKVIITDQLLTPTNLIYLPDTLHIQSTVGGNSVTPMITGSAPITYGFTSNPSSANISMLSNGVVQVSSGITDSTYAINITATNALGSNTFNNALIIVASSVAVLPNKLSYGADTIKIYAGDGHTQNVSQVSGTAPFSYSLSTSPAEPGITINPSTGAITINTAVLQGDYVADVTVTNNAGSVPFNSVLLIRVWPDAVRFTTDILPLVEFKCATCHTGGGQTDYTVYDNAKTNIFDILDRIQRTQGSIGFMPKNGTSLTSTQIALFQNWLTDGLIE